MEGKWFWFALCVVLVLPNLKRHKEDTVFFYEEDVKVFISKNC